MARNPGVIPMIAYLDGIAAMDWLASAFGARERVRHLGPDSRLTIDENYMRAKKAGATILSEPEDGPPGRRYRAEDLEGHRWMFLEK